MIKLSFEQGDPKLESFMRLIRLIGIKIEEVTVDQFKTMEVEKYPPYLTSDILQKSMLSDEAKYALLACITQQKINLFQITKRFFEQIEGEDPKVVEKTFKDIANRSEKTTALERIQLKNRLEDYFWTLFDENADSKPQWEITKEPDYMCKTKRVTITPTRIIYYVEEAELCNAVLRKYKRLKDQFLRVTLSDEVGEAVKSMKYISETRFKPLLESLYILNKEYKFLAFSASQLRANSLWMLTKTNELFVEKIHREIGDLSEIKNPAKYGARLGQLFSASFPVLDFEKVPIDLEVIKDIFDEKEKYTFSDGVGMISVNLLDAIKVKMGISGKISVIQIRFSGVKGILVANPEIGRNKICLRKSMMKFESNGFKNSLELLDYNKYRPGYLNRQIIMLLLTNGLDPKVFLYLQDQNIQSLAKMDSADANIFGYVNNEHHMSPAKDLLRDCMIAEVDIEKEPFVNGVVNTIKIRSFINLKEKSNILVEKAARLTGVLDEYGILNRGQIYLCVSKSNGIKDDLQVIDSERVIVTKNPCLHPGDIRILEAVATEEAKTRFKHLINCIVFPAKGSRPHTDEIAGSDLDGDMYFISWDQNLIPESVEDPMLYSIPKPPNQEVRIEDIISFFVNYTNNDVLGRIDNSHLAFADQDSKEFALNPNCKKLTLIHATAVDYAKNGVCPSAKGISFAKVWPDYMEKDPDVTYESDNILGNLYRLVRSEIETSGLKGTYKSGSKDLNRYIEIDEDMIVKGFEDFLKNSFDIMKEYYKDTQALMNLYGIQTEYEIFSGNFLKFMGAGKSKKYNLEKLQEKMVFHIECMKDKFVEMLFPGAQKADIRDIDNNFTDFALQKASALYVASYYNEKCQIEEVNEAVKKMFYEKKYKKFFDDFDAQFIGLPWYILKDVILEIKKKNKTERLKREEDKK